MNRWRIVLVVLLLLFAGTAADWPTDHGNNQRTGTTADASTFRTLRLVYNKSLDGAVYGSPLIVHGLVVVATENNTIYALRPGNGAVVWRYHPRSAVTDTSRFACSGNIDPSGITGTPAYDPVTDRIFFVTVSFISGAVQHEIWGVNSRTGVNQVHQRVDVPGTDAKAMQQRGALAVDNGNVYIAYGGLAGDCGAYKGSVVAVRADGAAGQRIYTIPTTREAGIWAAGGPVVGPDHSVFVAAGNGEETGNVYDYSDSITRLSPDMKRLDYFAPSTWPQDNAQDLDLGSLSPVLLPNGFLLIAGKRGTGYLLRSGHLGGIGGQVFQADLCSGFGVSAVVNTSVYLPCSSGLRRVDVLSSGRFQVVWAHGGIPGSPVTGPGGVLYSAAGGRLYALSLHDGSVRASVGIPSTTRFATPALYGNLVLIGTTAGISVSATT